MKKLLIIPTLLLLTGCYNYQDLNDIAIVTSINISKNKDQYETTIEIVNPKEKNNIIYKNSATSIEDSINKIEETCPRKLYLSHMNLLIIDESLAKNNLKDIIDYFARNTEIRNEFYILISQNKNILSKTNTLEKTTSEEIINNIKISHNYLGYPNLITFEELLDTYLNPNQELAIPALTNNTPKIAIFKNNHLIDYLDEKDSIVYNIITNRINNYSLKANINTDEFFISKIIKEKTTISTKKQQININIKGNVILTELHTKEKNINILEKEINKTLERLINTSLNNTITKYNTNIYGFKNNSKTYKINTNLKITQKGNLDGGIYE